VELIWPLIRIQRSGPPDLASLVPMGLQKKKHVEAAWNYRIASRLVGIGPCQPLSRPVLEFRLDKGNIMGEVYSLRHSEPDCFRP
jgi:hypothetical protein